MQNQKIKKIQIIKVTKNTRSITLNSLELKKLHKSSHASLYSYSICNSNSINITKNKIESQKPRIKKKYQLVDRHEIRKDLSIAITSISRDIITRKCCLCFERRETERERDREIEGRRDKERNRGKEGGYKMSNIKERRRKVTVIIPLYFYRNYQKCPKKELERRRYKCVVIKFTEKKISKKLGGLDWIMGFGGFFYNLMPLSNPFRTRREEGAITVSHR